jgi:hypothetical protein
VVGYDRARLDDEQFTCYRLGSFGDGEVPDYVGKWFATQEGAAPVEAEAKAKAFLAESASAGDLRSNPLLLSLMCILYRGAGSLPSDRAGIYASCAELLLRKSDEQRGLYRKVQADHLVEPTIRYLAWWLFTREDSTTAATEQEMVAKTSEFLYGRGYETKEEAEAAAREFVEFCRGRMWVFNDAGTTADGERLYAFTHRTFLEYFAALHLAAIYDSPEDLARALAPRVADSQWDMVGELAISAKSSRSDHGADRAYAVLLDPAVEDGGGMLPGGTLYGSNEWFKRLGNRLSFLAKCLSSIKPSPASARNLTDAALSHFFDSSRYYEYGRDPIRELVEHGGSYAKLIEDEIFAHIARVTTSADYRCHNVIVFFMVFDPLYTTPWSEQIRDSVSTALANVGRYLSSKAYLSVGYTFNEFYSSSNLRPIEMLLSINPASPDDEFTYLGLASVMFLTAELCHFNEATWPKTPFPGLSQTGNLLCRYIGRRVTGKPSELSDLPVPVQHRKILRDWAEDRVSFIEYLDEDGNVQV